MASARDRLTFEPGGVGKGQFLSAPDVRETAQQKGNPAMAYSDAVLAQARLWIGYREGPNDMNVFSSALGLGAEPWCVDFTQFVSASSGYKQPYKTSAVLYIGHWAQNNGHWIKAGDVPAKITPGCQLCYDWNNGHGQEPKDWQLMHTGFYIGNNHTIEGNTGDAPRGVLQQARALNAAYVWGAIDWPGYWNAVPHPQFESPGNRFSKCPAIQQNNSKNLFVDTFQQSLNLVLHSGLDVDGEFGPLTEAACKKFQQMSRIPVTGVCDQQTWASLDSALDKLGK